MDSSLPPPVSGCDNGQFIFLPPLTAPTPPSSARAVTGRWPQTSSSIAACRGFPGQPRWPPSWTGVTFGVLKLPITAVEGGQLPPITGTQGQMDGARRIAGPDAVRPSELGTGGCIAKPSLSESVWSLWSSPRESTALSVRARSHQWTLRQEAKE